MKRLNLQKVSLTAISFLSLFAVHPMTNFLGTDDFSDEQYYLNISSYSFGSERDTDNQTSNRLIKRALVSFAIENTLLTIGKGTLATVINQLGATHNCRLLDCYEHPDYFREILKLHGSDIYNASIKSIKAKLQEFTYDKEIMQFLQEISKQLQK